MSIGMGIVWTIIIFAFPLGLFIWGLVNRTDGTQTRASDIGLIIGILLLVALLVCIGYFGANSYTPTEEEIAQAQENYIEAYENTVALENYTIDAEISFKKGWLGITIGGDISKSKGVYSGNVVFSMPGNKYNCTYSAPHGESGDWSKLYVEGVEGNNCMNIPFNIADFKSGIICKLSDEILSTGIPTNTSLNNITFKLTDEQTQELYGVIFEFFKTMAGSDFDLSNLRFTDSIITVSLQDNMIKSFNVTLSGQANAGSISCEFKCLLKDVMK